MINFYPRSPCGERRMYHKVDRERACISIHALLAESDLSGSLCCLIIKISIHALLAESDVTVLGIQHRVGISIHALLAESDIGPLIFNVQPRNFYPRSPCGERLLPTLHATKLANISIHALLAESDYTDWQQRGQQQHFYPRSPCGERRSKYRWPY